MCVLPMKVLRYYDNFDAYPIDVNGYAMMMNGKVSNLQ